MALFALDGNPGPQGPAGDSHWQIVGDDTHYSAGRVGIGTASPTVALDVVGAAKFGWHENEASGAFSFVSGGIDEGLGLPDGTNTASGDFSFVGGGFGHTASGASSAMIGGVDNFVSGGASFIGGGISNSVTGNGSFVAGGAHNDASGALSFVGGGGLNSAEGDFVFAAGRQAKAIHDGTFVWADNTEADFASTGDNQFLVRAGGGVGFGREPSDYFVIDSGMVLQDTDYSFGTGALRVMSRDESDNAVTLFRILGNGGVAIGNSFNASGVPERGLKIQGRLALQTLGSGGATALCRNAENEVATCSSSARYKSDIRDLEDPMTMITSLRPVHYRWLDGSGDDIGLVAEEVAESVPALAAYANGQVEGVKYDRLSALLLGAVQQQHHEGQALRAQADRLVEQVRELAEHSDKLAQRNAELESRLMALESLLIGEGVAEIQE